MNMKNLIKYSLFIFLIIGGSVILQCCNGKDDNEQHPMTQVEKEKVIESLRNEYNDMGIKIIITNYDSLSDESIRKFEKILSEMRKYNEQQKKMEAK